MRSNYSIELDELYYVIVDPKKGFKFDIPNGNEIGAYDGQWIPRGKTKSGTSEAVLLNSEKLEHNGNWDAFVNFYGKGNVIFIKKYKANGK